MKAVFSEFGHQFKQNYLDTAQNIKDVWKEVKPLDPLKQDFDDTKGKAAKLGKDIAAGLKAAMEAELAGAEKDRAENKLLYDQKKINATQWEHLEVAAAERVNAAHAKYFRDLIAAYKKVGDAQKVKLTQQERDTQLTKDGTAAINAVDKAQKELTEDEKKYAELSGKALHDNATNMKDFADEMLKAKAADPWPPQAASLVKLMTALRSAGVEFGKLRQDIDAAQKAEKALTDAGLQGGKLWLEERKKELTATIALAAAEGHLAKQEIQDLQKVEKELKKYDKDTDRAKSKVIEFKDAASQALGQFAIDIGDAFAAAALGQESFAEGMRKAVGKLIQQLIQWWAQYFMAMAVADMFYNPARAAAELAAAAALEAVGGIIGGLISGGSSGGGGGKDSAPQVGGAQAVYQPGASGQAPAQTQSTVPSFAMGGLVTSPTLAMVGDAPGGEAILPLHDATAMSRISQAMGGGGETIIINVKGMISSDNLNKVVKKISRSVNRGTTRLQSNRALRVLTRG
jgi:hypothetical protein